MEERFVDVMNSVVVRSTEEILIRSPGRLMTTGTLITFISMRVLEQESEAGRFLICGQKLGEVGDRQLPCTFCVSCAT